MSNPNASTLNGWVAGAEGLINVWRLTSPWAEPVWKEAGLIPDGDLTTQLGSMGLATFKLLRRARVEVDPVDPTRVIEGSEVSANEEAPLDTGDFICVTVGVTDPTTMTQSDILWAGTIVQVARTEELFDDAPGTVSAVELGACFDDKSPGGWAFIGDQAVVPAVVAVNETAATWNLPPLAYGTDLARVQAQPNLMLHPDQDTYPGVKIFYSDMLTLAADAGILLRGTKADLIRHVLAFGRPQAWPNINLVLAPGTTDIIDSLDRNVEVIDPNGLTFRGLLDLVFPRAGGLAWSVGIDKVASFDEMKWRIVVVRTDAAETTLTANITAPVISLRSKDSTPAYDAVEVVGAPIVCCGTIPFRQPSDNQYDFIMGTKGWTEAAESKYVKAELSRLDDLEGSNPELYDETLSTFRSQGTMARVYKTFRPNLFNGVMWAGDCSSIGVTTREGSRPEYIENPGLRTPFFPTVVFNLGAAPTLWAPPSLEGKTTAVEILSEEAKAFAPPSPVVLRMLPWIPVRVGAVEGLEYQQVAAEQLLKPQLHSLGDVDTAEDMTLVRGADGIERPGIGLSPDTVTESVVLSVSPPDFFAFNRDGLRVDTMGDYRTYMQSEPTPVNAYSWEDMLLTAAYPHQQRLRVLFYREGRTNPRANGEDWIDYGWMPPTLRADTEKNLNVIRKMVVSEDRLQAWYVAPGTILSMRYDQGAGPPLSDSPFTTTPAATHTWTRNDYDSAHAYAMRLARRYFKDQRSYTLEVPRPDAPIEANGGLTHMLPGMWVGDIVLQDPDSATGRNKTINALVESVSRNFATGRMVITTAAPAHPVFYNNGSMSPSLGGPVSPSLGGTMAQAVGKLQSSVRELQTAQASAAPVVPFTPMSGGGGAGGTGLVVCRVIGGNPISGNDHPFGRPFIRATPFWDEDSQITTIPVVPDWTAVDLPKTWVYGTDKIVGLPDGLGIGMVIRPYSLGSATWSAAKAAPVYSAGNPATMNKASLKADRKTILIFGTSKTIVMTPDTPAPPGPPLFTVKVDDVSVTINSHAASTAGATLVLQSVIPDDAATITVSWNSTAFTDPSGTPLTTVAAGTLDVVPVGDKYTCVFLLNNVGAQGYGDGDYVLVDISGVSIADANSVTRTAYRIIGPVSGAVLHNHLSYAANGQGPSFRPMP